MPICFHKVVINYLFTKSGDMVNKNTWDVKKVQGQSEATLLIGESLSEPHQMLQRFQINTFQHRHRTGRHSNVTAMRNGI